MNIFKKSPKFTVTVDKYGGGYTIKFTNKDGDQEILQVFLKGLKTWNSYIQPYPVAVELAKTFTSLEKVQEFLEKEYLVAGEPVGGAPRQTIII